MVEEGEGRSGGMEEWLERVEEGEGEMVEADEREGETEGRGGKGGEVTWAAIVAICCVD